MRKSSTALAGVVCVLLCSESALGQPILDRVEQMLRRQLGSSPPPAAGAREPGYLGLVADDRQDQGRGVRVMDIAPGGPAASAGLRVGDLITAIDGRPIRTMDDMVATVASQTAGSRITISAQRDGAGTQHIVTMGRRPQAGAANRVVETLPPPPGPSPPADNTQGPRLGVRTVNVTEEARAQNKMADHDGATVVFITPGSAADLAGVPLGAVITAVDGQKVRTPDELAATIRSSKKSEVEVAYFVDGEDRRSRITLGEAAQAAPEPPKLELRGKPIQPPVPEPPGPAAQELPPPLQPSDHDARMEALETRIRELEARIEKLEAERAAQPAPK